MHSVPDPQWNSGPARALATDPPRPPGPYIEKHNHKWKIQIQIEIQIEIEIEIEVEVENTNTTINRQRK